MVIPPVIYPHSHAALPLENCVYCWYLANSTPFPASWTSTICDTHLQEYFPNSQVCWHSESFGERLALDWPIRLQDTLSLLENMPTIGEIA